MESQATSTGTVRDVECIMLQSFGSSGLFSTGAAPLHGLPDIANKSSHEMQCGTPNRIRRAFRHCVVHLPCTMLRKVFVQI
jgi:hypothetical protein